MIAKKQVIAKKGRAPPVPPSKSASDPVPDIDILDCICVYIMQDVQ